MEKNTWRDYAVTFLAIAEFWVAMIGALALAKYHAGPLWLYTSTIWLVIHLGLPKLLRYEPLW